MYSNNIVNFQESTTILNACPKEVWKLIECTMYFVASRNHSVSLNKIFDFISFKWKSNILFLQIEFDFDFAWLF